MAAGSVSRELPASCSNVLSFALGAASGAAAVYLTTLITTRFITHARQARPSNTQQTSQLSTKLQRQIAATLQPTSRENCGRQGQTDESGKSTASAPATASSTSCPGLDFSGKLPPAQSRGSCRSDCHDVSEEVSSTDLKNEKLEKDDAGFGVPLAAPKSDTPVNLMQTELGLMQTELGLMQTELVGREHVPSSSPDSISCRSDDGECDRLPEELRSGSCCTGGQCCHISNSEQRHVSSLVETTTTSSTFLQVAQCSQQTERGATKPDPLCPRKREGTLSWDEYFMSVAFLSAQRSKDPNRQVGACIVGHDNVILGIGYNGFPRGISDEELPWAKASADGDPLKTKYPYVCHAEVNAILNRNLGSAASQRIYVTMFPCNECAKMVIQAGIKEVIFFTDKFGGKEGQAAPDPSYAASRRLLALAKIKVRQLCPKRSFLHVDFI